MANAYAITGATGNIGHIITEKLLAEGHKVRAIARTAEKLRALAAKGAEIFPGSLVSLPASQLLYPVELRASAPRRGFNWGQPPSFYHLY